MDKKNNKPIETYLSATITFLDDEPVPNSLGIEGITYEFHYNSKAGVMSIMKLNVLLNRTLIKEYGHKNDRGLTTTEAITLLRDFANMTYKEFTDFIAEV